jgi:hypothetical protein
MDDTRYYKNKIISASSKGVILFGEDLKSHVNGGNIYAISSNFDSIIGKINYKIERLREEVRELKNDVYHCESEIRNIEEDEASAKEKKNNGEKY